MAWLAAAIVFLALLICFPRFTLSVIGLAVAAVAAFAGYGLLESQRADQLKAKVITTASYDPAVCNDPKWPIHVTFWNGDRSKTIEKLYFDLRAKRPGYSDNVISNYYMASDRVIAPQTSYSSCWNPYSSPYADKVELSGLIWAASISSVNWQ